MLVLSAARRGVIQDAALNMHRPQNPAVQECNHSLVSIAGHGRKRTVHVISFYHFVFGARFGVGAALQMVAKLCGGMTSEALINSRIESDVKGQKVKVVGKFPDWLRTKMLVTVRHCEKSIVGKHDTSNYSDLRYDRYADFDHPD